MLAERDHSRCCSRTQYALAYVLCHRVGRYRSSSNWVTWRV